MPRRPIVIVLSLALAACAAPPPPAPPAPLTPPGTFSGRVVAVTDGDHLTVLRNGVEQPVRLSGVDCPEIGQAFGKRARQGVFSLAAGQEVGVKDEGRDQAGAIQGIVTLPDGRNLNRELVRAGLCWWERTYAGDGSLPILEAEAHAARRGLWAGREPIPPWKWRELKVKPKVRAKDE